MIVDSGASVCISLCRGDFITYRQSKAKIRDLSKSNSVAGEGLIRWTMQDADGQSTTMELPGYHIPKAEVRLLSQQVVYKLVGGQGRQTSSEYQLCLGDGIQINAPYCSRSNLPIISLSAQATRRDTWANAFVYSSSAPTEFASQHRVLGADNTNLSASQKEAMLWHQRLSHASMSWIQLLMRDRK